MPVLLDVNVLMALAWPNHVHHAIAVEWFVDQKNHPNGWATTPLTQVGFIRVSSNTLVIPEAKRPTDARALLQQLTAREDHVFWIDDIDWAHSGWLAPDRVIGHRQVTDAHLIALARRHEGQLATFDRGITDVLPATIAPEDVLVLLNAGSR